MPTRERSRPAFRWVCAAATLAALAGVRRASADAPPKVGFDETVKLDDSKRQAWLKRGGGLVSYEARGNIMGILLPSYSFPTGCGGNFTSGEHRGRGVGGGVGARISYLYASLPTPGSSGRWFALRAGGGFDVQTVAMFIDVPQNYAAGFGGCLASLTETKTTYQVQVPLSLGGHLGLGGFGLGEAWSGVVVGLAWSPALMHIAGNGFDSITKLNLLGFEATLDFVTLHATMESYAQEAHLRIFGYLLPNVGSLPLVGVIGAGAVWY